MRQDSVKCLLSSSFAMFPLSDNNYIHYNYARQIAYTCWAEDCTFNVYICVCFSILKSSFLSETSQKKNSLWGCAATCRSAVLSMLRSHFVVILKFIQWSSIISFVFFIKDWTFKTFWVLRIRYAKILIFPPNLFNNQHILFLCNFRYIIQSQDILQIHLNVTFLFMNWLFLIVVKQVSDVFSANFCSCVAGLCVEMHSSPLAPRLSYDLPPVKCGS